MAPKPPRGPAPARTRGDGYQGGHGFEDLCTLKPGRLEAFLERCLDLDGVSLLEGFELVLRVSLVVRDSWVARTFLPFFGVSLLEDLELMFASVLACSS